MLSLHDLIDLHLYIIYVNNTGLFFYSKGN
nr:MAG TPA: hypothetical protein [Caudoviricetes sp.]